jgi:hypothetical protein
MKSGLQNMLSTAKNKSGFTVNQMVETIMTSGQITRRQHIQLTNAILSENQITEEDRRQINRILDYLQIGKIKIVDVGTTTKIQ